MISEVTVLYERAQASGSSRCGDPPGPLIRHQPLMKRPSLPGFRCLKSAKGWWWCCPPCTENWFWFWRSSGKEPKWGLFLSGPASKLPAPSVHPRHCGVVIAALSLKQILFLLIIFLTEILSPRMFLAGGSLSATGGARTHVFCSRALARVGRPRTGSFPDTQEASKLALCRG